MGPVVGSFEHDNKRPGYKRRVLEIHNHLSKRYLLKKESISWSSLCSNYKGTCEIAATVKLDDGWVQNATFGAKLFMVLKLGNFGN
jgi:hypothetical protein